MVTTLVPFAIVLAIVAIAVIVMAETMLPPRHPDSPAAWYDSAPILFLMVAGGILVWYLLHP